MANGISGEAAALALVGVGEVFQIMASMLPSPTTISRDGDPERIAQLKRNRLQGAIMAILLLLGVAYFVGKEDAMKGLVLAGFGGSALLLFWYESSRAFKIAESKGNMGFGY